MRGWHPSYSRISALAELQSAVSGWKRFWGVRNMSDLLQLLERARMSLVHTGGQQKLGTGVWLVTSLGNLRHGERRCAGLGGVPLGEMQNLMGGLNGDLSVLVDRLRV